MSGDVLKNEFLPKYLASGEQKFYRFLLIYALNKLILINKNAYKGIDPNIELMNYYEQFIILYRREGEDNYLQIARLLRKAGHKVYRIMLKKGMTQENDRFLNVV